MKEQTTYKKDALNRFSVSDAGKQAAGMYDPGYEHDNCGIGSVVNIKGIKTHETVENALKIVENLKHLSLIHILTAIYSTGVGKIKIRGKVEVEQVKGGKERLVITEIPYTMIGARCV